MRRYRMAPRERFLPLDELKRLGFVLDHTGDEQAAAAKPAAAVHRRAVLGDHRSAVESDTRARAVLPDSLTGPKAMQLPPPARAILNGLPGEGRYVFPNRKDDGPMRDLGLRWQKLRGHARLDDARLHDGRHTFASHAVMSGPRSLHRRPSARPADTASTERHAHLADEHVREAAGRISGIVDEARTGNAKEAGR